MSTEQFSFENNKEKSNFDPNDPWDLKVVEIGKGFSKMNTDANAMLEEQTTEKLYELGVAWEAGGQFQDGFGAWEKNPHGDWVTEKPSEILTPDQVEEFTNGVRRVQIHYVGYGQPDGPGTRGVVWYARLWDQVKDEEIPNSRVLADKLSYAISGVMAKMPDYGREIFQTFDQIVRKSLEKEVEFLDMLEDELIKNKSDEEYTQIWNELCLANPIFKDVLKHGSFKEWLDSQLEGVVADEQLGNKLMSEIQDMMKELESKFPKENNSNDDEDEGEEWKK